MSSTASASSSAPCIRSGGQGQYPRWPGTGPWTSRSTASFTTLSGTLDTSEAAYGVYHGARGQHAGRERRNDVDYYHTSVHLDEHRLRSAKRPRWDIEHETDELYRDTDEQHHDPNEQH